MKTKFLNSIGVVIFFLMTPFYSGAQDWSKLNPRMNNVLADTTFLRATEVTLAPGEKSDVHTHPSHFFYALTEGKLMVYYKDGEKEKYDLKAGDSGVSGPERPHWTENVGTTTLKFLMVELKEHPYKAMKMSK